MNCLGGDYVLFRLLSLSCAVLPSSDQHLLCFRRLSFTIMSVGHTYIHTYRLTTITTVSIQILMTDLSIYNYRNRIILLLRKSLYVFLSVCLKFDFRENRSPGELQTRPMCCSKPDDVPFIFEFANAVKLENLTTSCGIRYAFTANVVVGHSADGGALYCLIGGRHRAGLNDGFSQKWWAIGGQS